MQYKLHQTRGTIPSLRHAGLDPVSTYLLPLYGFRAITSCVPDGRGGLAQFGVQEQQLSTRYAIDL